LAKREISGEKEEIHNPWETRLLEEGEVREEEGKYLEGEKVEKEVIFKDRNGFGLALMEDTNHHLQFKVQPLCIPLFHK